MTEEGNKNNAAQEGNGEGEKAIAVQEGSGSTSSGSGMNLKKFFAEVIGTSCLTYIACGTAAVSNDFTQTFLSFGLTVVAMAYSIGNVSGCHINPAVSLAMFVRRKMDLISFFSYIGAQIVGSMVGSVLLGLCLRGEFDKLGGTEIAIRLKDPDDGDKDGWSYASAFLLEVFLTFIFVFAVCGATDKRYQDGKHAGIVIGGALALVNAAGGKLTGPSVNPVRSLAPAIFQAIDHEKDAIKQIWIFIIAPLIGGALSGLVYDLML